ncbi:uncharacterized protein BDZ99DRAFT_490508 [Mytilinidion resinicola]|uniref:Uncharacterized protein n=1 Tax=Mytilinidion resinicola TaxID=574789 RepID=A0A6A6Y9N2_9PEZI|nr:uncharacterized protein BDZ99DRAFT_490508 [Mytilinidion resinicola]KAF2805400.1 hypothetical protein BDZ99DRAFT_490508 [Mytilinidion resinicola]
MLDVGDFRNAFSGRRRLLWTDGTLTEFVHSIFRPESILTNEGIKLDALFTARNLDRIAGFKVELTTNLADHLSFRDSDSTVMVFHHASFLKRQQGNPIFPAELITETLHTLSVLFPRGDRDAKRWYNKQEDPEELDLGLFECGLPHRRIEGYKYWHDRLVILKQAFDESRPATFSQWWNDRREGVQWYSLWIAIAFTVFFGLVQSIKGALQVYNGWHPTPIS